MAYFFGFFGISFLDTNAMERSPSTFGLSHLDNQLYTSRDQRPGGAFAKASSSAAAAAGKGVNGGRPPAPVSNASTMCAKEAPQLVGTVGLPPLGPIPEGEEYSSMTNEEVKAKGFCT